MGIVNYNTQEVQALLDKVARGPYTGYIYKVPDGSQLLTTAETYYPITGSFLDNGTNNGFNTSAAGVLTYNGATTEKAVISGTSDCEVDKACQLTYGLFKNDVLIATSETPHIFSAQSKIENISITAIFNVTPLDTYQIKAKSSVANTTLTVKTLNVTFHEA